MKKKATKKAATKKVTAKKAATKKVTAKKVAPKGAPKKQGEVFVPRSVRFSPSMLKEAKAKGLDINDFCRKAVAAALEKLSK